MGKKRQALAFMLLLVVATLIIIATLFAIKYFQETKRAPAPLPPPIEAPPPLIAPPEPREPAKADKADKADKPKEVEKPKEGTKPPKVTPPLSKTDEDEPGKVRLCPNRRETATLAEDGRLLGHRPYGDANATDLGSSPAGFSGGSCAQLHGEAKVALEKLIAGARATDPAIAEAMIGLSCFRSAKYQREVFCRKVSDGFAVRARASAPPGYSEHATGYVIDFGDRNVPACNLNACFATTPVGQWLAANAGQYGFVLSFPEGNSQGVMYEPWHWRYQGTPAAQAIFAGAN
jgi:zinc D-Ala-D-Ala carboxypeptidase